MPNVLLCAIEIITVMQLHLPVTEIGISHLFLPGSAKKNKKSSQYVITCQRGISSNLSHTHICHHL